MKPVEPLPENVAEMLNTVWVFDIANLSELSVNTIRKAKHGIYSERTRKRLMKAFERLQLIYDSDNDGNREEMEFMGMYYDESSGDYVSEEEMEDIEMTGGVHNDD